MPDSTHQENDFLSQIKATVEQNIANDQFGVSELADAVNMSRSNLLRKVKKITNLSVSQLISEVRLQRGMKLLRTSSFNVSEVSHQVGFSSTSYFIKCFREYYGYPPGEVGKRGESEPVAPPPEYQSNRKSNLLITGTAGLLVAVAGWFVYNQWPVASEAPAEKSIAVLPFKNDSNDSTNIYLINGLMEATLNNLQKIKDLKVLSRTSAEKYRNSAMTIPELAKELNAHYFVEGSGQKIGDRILLNIQLIDGATDRHLWSKQYRRDAKDIFALQQEVSRDIAKEIQVVITPEEKTRIEKIPTSNTAAYDSFLKGIDLLNKGGDPNLEKAIAHFQEAFKEDNKFALAYACAGMACYYLDVFRSEKKYADELGSYADKALLYDPRLGESLTAKAMYYMVKKEYSQALPYLEKGLEYNPNSTQIIGLLADFYAMYLPNTGKYLEYALIGLRLGANSGDSVSVSYMYLRLGNALIQTGFVDESLMYIDKSLEYNPNNPFSRYVRAFVLYAKNRNLSQTKELLLTEFRKDTTRFDILQDIGKVSYYLDEYDTAYKYYKRFNRMRETQKLDVYQHENMIIGLVYGKVGQKEKSEELINSYKQYLDRDQTAYKNLGLAAYYSHVGDNPKALDHLKLFALEDNIQYWIILFLRDDPMMTNTKDLAECEKILSDIETKFWKKHGEIKESLEEKGLM